MSEPAGMCFRINFTDGRLYFAGQQLMSEGDGTLIVTGSTGGYTPDQIASLAQTYGALPLLWPTGAKFALSMAALVSASPGSRVPATLWAS